jgi:hypothetical protein
LKISTMAKFIGTGADESLATLHAQEFMFA